MPSSSAQQHPEARANHRLVVRDEDADRSSRLALQREPCTEDEAAAVYGARGHLTAAQLDPLADSDKSVAETVAARRAAAVVAHVDLQLV